MIKNICDLCGSEDALGLIQNQNGSIYNGLICCNCKSVDSDINLSESQINEIVNIPNTHIDDDGSILELMFAVIGSDIFTQKDWRKFTNGEDADIEIIYSNSMGIPDYILYGLFEN